MNNKLKHKFKMLNKLRNRGASPARILRAMRAFEKEKEGLSKSRGVDEIR